MNLQNKAVKRAIALGLGVMGIIAMTACAKDNTKDVVSQQATEVATGRTAGVVLSLNELEEQALAELQSVDYEQMQAVFVTAAEEAVASIPEGQILTE